ncbi:MAG: response regulator [Opitutales bacterium]
MSSLRRHRVLLVEDQPTNQLISTKILEKIGCQVELAVNGLEAVEKVRETPFDAIFMDCQMPEMDGIDATLEIRRWELSRSPGKAPRPVPIIAVTAGAANASREECLEAGMNDYLLKPIRVSEFVGALARWCGRHSAVPFAPESSEGVS